MQEETTGDESLQRQYLIKDVGIGSPANNIAPDADNSFITAQSYTLAGRKYPCLSLYLLYREDTC